MCASRRRQQLSMLAKALESERQNLNARLDVRSIPDWQLRTEQEFLDVRLARFIARYLNTDQAKEEIVRRQGERTRDDLNYEEKLPTLRVSGNRLRFGPEPVGNVDAFRSYLSDETSEDATIARLTPRTLRLWSWIPVLMAAALVASWSLPLQNWSIAVASIVFAFLMVLTILPARTIGWQTLFRQTTAVAATGFFGIAIFGLAYAARAIAGGEELRNVTSLGDPFLTSTGLGVAGGILDEYPKGAARIIAHLQLLLFLSGLIGVVAVLLRIDRSVRRGRG
jgi:hypothetical protein